MTPFMVRHSNKTIPTDQTEVGGNSVNYNTCLRKEPDRKKTAFSSFINPFRRFSAFLCHTQKEIVNAKHSYS